jgi:hypothetical protein
MKLIQTLTVITAMAFSTAIFAQEAATSPTTPKAAACEKCSKDGKGCASKDSKDGKGCASKDGKEGKGCGSMGKGKGKGCGCKKATEAAPAAPAPAAK